jgi:hypothetical protein
MQDGFSIKVALEDNATISLWEVSVKPPSMGVGDKIDHTTQHNTLYRTAVLRQLIEVGQVTGDCAYDPNIYTQITSVLGVRGGVTVTFPDGTTLDFWGGLTLFDPQPMSEGNPPRANFTIEVCNLDDAHAEAGPVLTDVAGTP